MGGTIGMVYSEYLVDTSIPFFWILGFSPQKTPSSRRFQAAKKDQSNPSLGRSIDQWNLAPIAE